MPYQILKLDLNTPADAQIADWVFSASRIARDGNGNEMFNPQGKPIYNERDAVVAAVVAKGSFVTIYDYLPTDETYLDGRPLSARTAEAKEASVDWFIARVILPFLGQSHPELYDALVPGPSADAPLRPFVRPEALRHPDIQAACEKVLDTPASLQAFLDKPGELMAAIVGVLSKSAGYTGLDELPVEFSKFVGVAGRPAFVHTLRNDMELTFSAGDQNTYLLVGVDQSKPNAPRPHKEGWNWLLRELDSFGETNGFVPSFGFMTSDARRYQRVIAGPGVGERELDYLRDKGCTIIDRTGGSPIGPVKDYPPSASTETSEQKN